MESHKQLYQPKDNVSVPRQDVTVSKSTVPTKRTAKPYDSDYDDYEVVEENLSAATRADYVSQVERIKLRTANKHDSDYDDYEVVEQNSAATRADYVNQVERNKSRPSSDYKEYVKLPIGKQENSFAKKVATQAAAESDKYDYVNQGTVDQQHTSVQRETTSDKSGPSSLSSLFSESPRHRSNALPTGMSRGISFESPLASPTCPTKHEQMSQGAVSNRPSNLSVGPDQSRERSSSRSELDTMPEVRALSPRSSKDKQALSQKVVSTDYSQTPEIEIPANITGSWTCTYCTNIVVSEPACDICGNEKREI